MIRPIKVNLFWNFLLLNRCNLPLPDTILFIDEEDIDKWERLCHPKFDYGLSVTYIPERENDPKEV